MPPWHADPRHGQFSNDRRLTRDEIDTLAAWVDGGMAQGRRRRTCPSRSQWPKGWSHGKPDVVFEMPEEFEVPATGVVPYKNFIIDPKFTEDRWVQVAECRPGAPGVVHHVVAYIHGGRASAARWRPNGSISILVGWAPGDLGLVCPQDTALRLPKGAELRLEMHYTPNGTKVKDRSSVGITFAKKPPKYELRMSEFANMAIAVAAERPALQGRGDVPPARRRPRSSASPRTCTGAARTTSTRSIYPDGKTETLLSVPRWDFNWQNVYRFEEPVKLPKGTKLHAVAHWDNSKNNPLNPAPDKKVRLRPAIVGRDDGRLRRPTSGSGPRRRRSWPRTRRSRRTCSSTASTSTATTSSRPTKSRSG